MSGAVNLRERNRADWQRPDWVSRMVDALRDESHFRWFDSGDMYHIGLARKILEVMRLTPDCRHWLPTRMGKFPKFWTVIQQMRALPNVAVRWSSDSVTGGFGPHHGSTIIHDANHAPHGVTVCRAYARGGKCGSFRSCWNKSVAVIAYPAHGNAMTRKVIPLALAA